YEHPELSGVAAYMTAEELTNWTLAALMYIEQTQDDVWAKAHAGTLEACLTSLVNRDDSDPGKRDGVMTLESDRAGIFGHEITTYDALDASLGPARRSAYLACKQWAAYVCLAKFFAAHGKPEFAQQARQQARRVADAMAAAAKPLGHIPALLPTDGPAEPTTGASSSSSTRARRGTPTPTRAARSPRCGSRSTRRPRG